MHGLTCIFWASLTPFSLQLGLASAGDLVSRWRVVCWWWHGSGSERREHAWGARLHPHHKKWQQLYGIVIDGVRFSYSMAHGGGARTRVVEAKSDTMASSTTSKQIGGNDSLGSSPKSTAKKDMKDKKGHGNQKQGNSASNLSESLVVNGIQPTSTTDLKSAAGIGGRWVHVLGYV